MQRLVELFLRYRIFVLLATVFVGKHIGLEA